MNNIQRLAAQDQVESAVRDEVASLTEALRATLEEQPNTTVTDIAAVMYAILPPQTIAFLAAQLFMREAKNATRET